MVAASSHWDHDEGKQDDRLEALLSDARARGSRRVFDREGNLFEVRPVSASVEEPGGPQAGETIPDWLRRTLPSGEGIDAYGLRNPERSGLYPAWMWSMWEGAEQEDVEGEEATPPEASDQAIRD